MLKRQQSWNSSHNNSYNMSGYNQGMKNSFQPIQLQRMNSYPGTNNQNLNNMLDNWNSFQSQNDFGFGAKGSYSQSPQFDNSGFSEQPYYQNNSLQGQQQF